MPTATGQAIPVAYGYVWCTGVKHNGITLQNTGDHNKDWTRIGQWLLGRGEWDGLVRMYDSALDRLLFTNDQQDPTHFHFHRGCDAVIGSGLGATSTGPDQGVDSFHQYLPAGVQPLTYNRIANYWIMLKQEINNPPSDTPKQSDPSYWTDINPIGLWRACKVRLFDETGAMTGYAFSTNPAWQMLDLILDRQLMPEYNISFTAGIDDLTDAVRRRIDFGAWVAAANSFDAINPNTNRRNFVGNWLFNGGTSLQAVLSPMAQACRSYLQERAGRIGLYFDQARPSVFTMSRQNTLSFTPSDKSLATAANRYVGKFRNLLVTAVNGHIVSIDYPDHQAITVTMSEPHPFAVKDEVAIGGTNTTYDTTWIVDTVPTGDQVYTFTLKSRGSNYPASVGVGGRVGLVYTRFKERSPEWNHHQNQYAGGAIGVGIPRQRSKRPLEIDFGTCAFDQVSRISRYERDRALGFDVKPYVTPVSATAELDLFARDAAGTAATPRGIDPGDRITIDDTLSVPFAGDYEVLSVQMQPDTAQGGRVTAGKVSLQLGPYDPGYMYDTYDPAEAGWIDVPGSDPGNTNNFSGIDLADGIAAFFTGLAADGDTLDIPDAGFSDADFLGWCSTAGYIDTQNHMHIVKECDFDSGSRIIHCQYADGFASDASVWTGDAAFAGLSWRSLNAAAMSTVGAVTYVELTLSGGEKILVGSGLVPGDGSYTVQLLPGYTLAKSICLAFWRDSTDWGDNNAHGFRAVVDASGKVSTLIQDGDGNTGHAGQCRLFVWAWQNNVGTVTQDPSGWFRCPLTTGKTLAWLGFESYDPGLGGAAPPNHVSLPLTAVPSGTIPLPANLSPASFQAITGPASFQIVDHPTHGPKAIYVTGDLTSLSQFEDGEGNTWYATAAGFALLCDTPTTT